MTATTFENQPSPPVQERVSALRGVGAKLAFALAAAVIAGFLTRAAIACDPPLFDPVDIIQWVIPNNY